MKNENVICMTELENVQLDGIDRRDYPDFCDAFVAYARWKTTGEALTEEELYRIDPNATSALALLEVCGG